MVLNSQRTVYGVDLELARLANKPYNIINNTSLNEKFNVLVEETVPANTYPTLKYFALGVGEVDIIKNNSGYSYSRHSPVDAALFHHIPFVIKPVNNDLSDTERARYRFRVVEVINGISYACYYLKLIDTFELKDTFYKVSTNQGLSTLSIFDTNIATLLNPVPRDRSKDVISVTSAEYILKLMKITFELTPNELTELDNVLTLKQLSSSNLTEIGLCTGIDKVVGNYSEATCVQVSHHIGINVAPSVYLNTGNSFLRSIELGGGEPMVL